MTHVFDLHDEAFYIWRELAVRDAILVHVDGHHDAQPASPSGVIGIGNYVRAAADEGFVSRVIWVVPGPLWDDASGRAAIDRVLEEARPLEIEVRDLAGLPSFAAPVLLDVDVDYFFTTGFGRDPVALRLAAPWCQAGDLAASLRRRCPRRIVTTIATSITGGFTPYEWKHLGVELAETLERGAEREVHVAEEPRYHPFRTPGHVYRSLGRLDEAEACFRDALDSEPADVWAAVGLAMIALARGDATGALKLLPSSADMAESLDWWRTRGAASAALGDDETAIDAYVKALALATRGAVPLDARTSNRDRRLADPAHWADHGALAALYERRGDVRLARVHRAMADSALGGTP